MHDPSGERSRHGRNAGPTRSGPRPPVRNAALAAVVAGMFLPWRTISYFGIGRTADGPLPLPGGAAYVLLAAAFVTASLCSGAGRRRGRPAVVALGLALLGYSAFWLVGGIASDIEAGGPVHGPTAGVGVILSVFGAAVTLWAVLAECRSSGCAPAVEEQADLVLPAAADGQTGALVPWGAFVDRIETLSNPGARPEPTPVAFVRVDGLDELRRRHGGLAADQVTVELAHRLRAHLRAGDAVTRLIPSEVFILLPGQPSEQATFAAVRRLHAALAAPIGSVNRRWTKEVKITAQVVRAEIASGRLRMVADDGCLVDAPLGRSDRPDLAVGPGVRGAP